MEHEQKTQEQDQHTLGAFGGEKEADYSEMCEKRWSCLEKQEVDLGPNGKGLKQG